MRQIKFKKADGNSWSAATSIWLGGILALGASLFMTLTAKSEETENSQYFGVACQACQKRPKMFIPYEF